MPDQPMPSGICFCGCGENVPAEGFFVQGHDQRAIHNVIKLEFGDAPGLLAAFGYGPDGKNLQDEVAKHSAT